MTSQISPSLSSATLTHESTMHTFPTLPLKGNPDAIFVKASQGVLTAKDEWLYDFAPDKLAPKVAFFIQTYEKERLRWQQAGQRAFAHQFVAPLIKWTPELIEHLTQNRPLQLDLEAFRWAAYRPFIKKRTYFAPLITHRPYQQPCFFPFQGQVENPTLCLTYHKQVPLTVHAVKHLPDNGYGSRATQSFSLFWYDENGQRQDNISDAALEKFKNHYANISFKIKAKNIHELKASLQKVREAKGDGIKPIKKEDIFAYVYAVLQSLDKKDFQYQIPLYKDFWKWVQWGRELLTLHLDYEQAPRYPLERITHVGQAYRDTPNLNSLDGKETFAASTKKVSHLKSYPAQGRIRIDAETELAAIPLAAWRYRLAGKPAIEWVLQHYQPRHLRDKSLQKLVAEGRFAPYDLKQEKENLISLLGKVVQVALKSVEILEQIRQEATQNP
ncbi:type ISP restriction/modification enzyme [Hugenholtzia roseola]|uniref:type ISP restriction/modification enzyme n=1 Tax=Hugenholtzia roseola TaxID=1002 RepID=UPI00047BF282|nr:type ISP restriction/modification enzyme [Hugenholtzia roseola]